MSRLFYTLLSVALNLMKNLKTCHILFQINSNYIFKEL